MFSMKWTFLIVISHSVSAQYVSYGCYSEPLNVSCSDGQIHPLSVSVGVNTSSLYCPRTYLEGLSNIKAIREPYNDDICTEELSPGQSYTYHENCIGRTQCSANALVRMEMLSCNNSVSTNFSTFMEMEYECIARNSGTVSQTSDMDGSLYIQGNRYVKDGISNHTNGFPQACSIHSSSPIAAIKIEILDLRLLSNNGTCTQSIIFDDGSQLINVTCNDNTDFDKGFFFPTNTSCLNLTLSNSSDNGYFWFNFTVAEMDGSVHIECPPISCTKTAETTSIKSTAKATITTSAAATPNSHIANKITPRPQHNSKLTYILLGIFLSFFLLSLVLVVCCLWKKSACMMVFRKRKKSSVYPDKDQHMSTHH